MRILSAFLLVGAVGCMDLTFSAGEQQLGAEHCTTAVTVSSSGAGQVAVGIDEGFNAWKGSSPSVTFTGTSTTCSSTTQFTKSATGTWSFGPHNQECSADYTGGVDLSAVANHWHHVIHCDNSIEVVGCQGDASYVAAVLVDGPGVNDFTTTVSGTIAAVQDPDVADVCEACPIGACVSACQAACGKGDSACSQCCECQCKEEGRLAGNDACEPQDLCYTGSPGHAVCLGADE
jgi:hypothetical protein